MATSAFKSATRCGGSAGAYESPSHRRARSLSRPAEYRNAPKGKFVNKKRGSECPVDDLALELFSSPREGRSGRRSGELGRWASDTASSKRRGRDNGAGSVEGSDGTRTHFNNSSRRRSVSVVRYHSDVDISQSFRHQGKVKNLNDKSNSATSVTKAAPNGRQLGRSLSQKHISLLRDGYSVCLTLS
ncbi:hypothetical protein Leryth_001372 [Lithospermum erythrorhizon]|nr:hypothetical protein Leryth_001372 [Lithospermum erythrorhizon]